MKQIDAGFAGSLGMGERPALLVIDLIAGYFLPESPLYSPRYAESLSQMLESIAFARSSGWPVLYTRLTYDQQHWTGGHFLRKISALTQLQTHPHWAEWVNGLAPGPKEPILTKQYASAFHNTPLLATLNFLRVDTLVHVGLSASGCVRATATDAMQYGYIPIVVEDAVEDRSAAIKEANLYDLQAKYADVMPLVALKKQWNNLK
ncbi:MAG: isochorismatase family protein [Nitritalea sp.]